jgi:hypothetical protein
LQWQDTKLPLAVTGYQTACTQRLQQQQQQQQSKMYTHRALQALAGKNLLILTTALADKKFQKVVIMSKNLSNTAQ